MPSRIYIVLITVLFSAIRCSNADSRVSEANINAQVILPVFTEKKRHLNINVLIDFSDHISTKNSKKPGQKERDIAIIKTFCQAFKNNVDAFNAFNAQAKMNVFFHPQPNDERVALIANKLNVSCKKGNSALAARHNKTIYQTLDANFSTGLQQIYDLAINAKEYPGSRIFNFMKEEAVRHIEDPAIFRNLLIILTDGYVYHENEKFKEKNRYSYIERTFEHFTRFRNRPLLESEFEKKDYGFVNIKKNLSAYEVMVLELSPPDDKPIDFEIMKKYWSKWLTEMGITKHEILQSNQPVYTLREVDKFLTR